MGFHRLPTAVPLVLARVPSGKMSNRGSACCLRTPSKVHAKPGCVPVGRHRLSKITRTAIDNTQKSSLGHLMFC